VVLLILSVSLGLFLGFNYQQQARVELKAQGHAVIQFMRAAKSTAIIRGEVNTCLYNPQSNTMRTTLKGRVQKLSSQIELRIGDSEVDDESELAVFYPDGAAETEDISLTLLDSEETIIIHIDPLFGDIELVDR